MKTKEYKPLYKENKKLKEEVKSEDVIKDLIDTNWSKDNDSQMKAVQLLKGISLSDEAIANKFMKKIDDFTSKMKVEDLK